MTLPLEPSYILALETAITGGSISLLRDSVVIDSMAGNDSLSRAEELLPNITSILDKNGISLDQIERIAVSVGPGSYTGIRIGMASAMGLSTAIDSKCVGVPILYAMTLLADKGSKRCLTAVPVGRGDTAYQLFMLDDDRGLRPLDAPGIAANADFDNIVACLEPDCVIVHGQIHGLLGDLSGMKLILTGNDLASLIGRASGDDWIPHDLVPIYLLNKNRNNGLF
ncbi:MAG: tRNA (adenosine(37)-N6)-threonylcarbamoyltransferase complex dimerization subunit type 1 TsaB [Acidobacteria bacterium]|nr:tRNA (adenosine(37)-N6)-threonylcarbamoyltransferase complex dimerization subunit type 1 TsaB [Acidobacteriota bacterium]